MPRGMDLYRFHNRMVSEGSQFFFLGTRHKLVLHYCSDVKFAVEKIAKV